MILHLSFTITSNFAVSLESTFAYHHPDYNLSLICMVCVIVCIYAHVLFSPEACDKITICIANFNWSLCILDVWLTVWALGQ